jgi:hypothetical protein
MSPEKKPAIFIALALIVIFGAVKSFMLPLTLSALGSDMFDESPMAYLLNSVIHGLVVLGWTGSIMTRDFPEARGLSKRWILFALVAILVGAVVPVSQTVLIKINDGLILAEAMMEVALELSETAFYAVGYGLGFALFRLEEKKRLMMFHIPLALLWIIGPLPTSVLFYLGVPFSGSYAGPHLFYPDVGPPIWVLAILLIWNWRLWRGSKSGQTDAVLNSRSDTR